MNDEARRKYEEELLKDAERIMEEVNNDPDLKDVTAPPEMRENIFAAIHAKEEERKIENLSEENKELIRLGKIYKKKRKHRKYLVLVAVMVLTMAFGITSMGDAKKVFKTVTWMMGDRKQTNVDSEGIEPVQYAEEEEAYEEIEEKFGFYPVRLNYLPEGVEFKEVTIGEEIQEVQLIYGAGEDLYISYFMRPNYRISSWGSDVEDELLEEYQVECANTQIDVSKYQVNHTNVRWSIKFEYLDVSYALLITEADEEEVSKIINSLYFPN